MRIESRNPALNAVIVPMYEQAREAAQRHSGAGPLAGVPLLVKDLVANVAGVPTGSGNRLLRSIPWPHDSELVRRLRGAGTVLLGKTNTPEFGLVTYTLGLLGRATPASDYALAVDRLQLVARSVAAFFERYPVLLTPTLAQPPIEIGALQPLPSEQAAMRSINAFGAGWLLRLLRIAKAIAARNFAWIPYTPLFNITGQPAMSVPLHWNGAGLPIGVQFVGRFGDETTLLRLAGQLERALPWADRRPPLRVAPESTTAPMLESRSLQ